MQEIYYENKKILTKCGQPFCIKLRKKTTGEVESLDGELVLNVICAEEYEEKFQGVEPSCNDDFESCLALTHEANPHGFLRVSNRFQSSMLGSSGYDHVHDVCSCRTEKTCAVLRAPCKRQHEA